MRRINRTGPRVGLVACSIAGPWAPLRCPCVSGRSRVVLGFWLFVPLGPVRVSEFLGFLGLRRLVSSFSRFLVPMFLSPCPLIFQVPPFRLLSLSPRSPSSCSRLYLFSFYKTILIFIIVVIPIIFCFFLICIINKSIFLVYMIWLSPLFH